MKIFSKYSFLLAGFALIILMIIPEMSFAQCPMCRGAAESSLREGATTAAGLNKGILYLFLFPYTMAAVLGFIWWKKNRDYDRATGNKDSE